ncbi:VOC family protein [Roseovarius salinarum]|uniref:VOC family protein n=1 Tax=Roseovarius salinarum TaxID=1981892 RepID=UPI000C31D7B4|nr:VOC family protein [Roseovarius salinarum]
MLALDHLAVAAQTLEAGRETVESALGVQLQPGGSHPHFGTHNMLLGLGDGLYLEVIAIDPEAPPPGQPRWFGLDRFAGPPRLTNWICRTGDMRDALAHWPEAGRPTALARGDLRWQMAVPDDGLLPFDGLFPALIEWQCAEHPAQRLPDAGCRLVRLTLHHPRAERLAALLQPGLADARVAVLPGAPCLRAEIETPYGLRVLT